MSRCFPFPPPGYDKKINTTDSELLKKEKDREKKHKKDKKDREKKEDRRKEDKSKRDRDRSDGKSKEKKDKKEKHRDKKEKERDKEKQTNGASTSGEKEHKLSKEQNGFLFDKKNTNSIILSVDSRLPGRTVDHNERSNDHNNKVSLVIEGNGAKVVQISDRKINSGSNGVRGQTGERVTKKRHVDGVGTFFQNTHLDNYNDSNLAQELDRRLKNEAEQPHGPTPVGRKPIGAQQKRDGGVIKMVSLDSMEKGDHRIKDAQENRVETKSMGAAVVSHHFGELEGMSCTSLGGNSEKGAEGHKRTKHREDEHQKRGEKRKEKDRNGEKKSHGKDKSRDKEKKVDRENSRGDQTKAEQSTREGSLEILHGSPNLKMLHTDKCGENNFSKEEKPKKAKEHLTNGFFHVTGPIKLSGPSSYNLQTVNGRAPEPCEIPVMSSSGQVATNNVKLDKVRKVNGIIETHVQHAAAEQAVKVQARQRSPHPVLTEQVIQVQARPRSPHPDAKRLSEILSVPKIEELCDLDDTDWLFSSKERPEKKLKVYDSRGGVSNADVETPQVWSQATNIESVNIYALPYVIPY